MKIGKEEYENEKINKMRLEIAKRSLKHHKEMVEFYEKEISSCK